MADIQDMRSVEKEWEYGTDIASKLLAHPSCTKLLGDGVKQDPEKELTKEHGVH